MSAPGLGWTIFWGVLAALGTGAWLVGIGGFGMTVSHSGLATEQHWIEWTAIVAIGSAFACAAAAMLLRSLAIARQRSFSAALASIVLVLVSVLQVAVVVAAWSDLPSRAVALALAACAFPVLLAVGRALSRAAPRLSP